MKKTSIRTLKRETKDLLKGRWLTGVKITFIPAILLVLSGLFISFIVSLAVFFLRQTDMSTWSTIASNNYANNKGTQSYSFIWGLISNVIGILMYTGISFTFLDWLRNPEDEVEHPFKSAFQGFTSKYIGTLIVLALITKLFTWLWSLLLIIPGIVMFYAYRMVYFIYKDHEGEQIGFLNMITMSKTLMRGNRWRLFRLDLSFIGWFLLGMLFSGIPLFWVLPYYHGTVAAFYKDLVTQQVKAETVV